MKRKKRLNLPIKQIINDYNNGMNTIELGKKYNCSGNTIIRRLKENDIKIRSRSEIKILKLPIEQIINEYQNGINSIKLGEKYGCSNSTIINKLKENNIKIRSSTGRKPIELPIKQIIVDYNNGINIIKLSKIYKCNQHIIYKRLNEHGINITRFHDIIIKQIIDEYNNGINQEELGKKYDCSPTTIHNLLLRNNINLRNKDEIYNIKINSILPVEKIINLYTKEFKSINIISNIYNSTFSIIRTLLLYNKIKLRSKYESFPHFCLQCGDEFIGGPCSIYCPNCSPNEYCYKWDENCKESNRDKYDRECFFCGKSEEENGKKLSVHHVDYNKNQGCDETPDWKLVPLCKNCHGLTHGGIESRKIWKTRILYLHKEYWGY